MPSGATSRALQWSETRQLTLQQHLSAAISDEEEMRKPATNDKNEKETLEIRSSDIPQRTFVRVHYDPGASLTM